MKLLVHASKVLAIDMGEIWVVEIPRGQHFLNGSQVGAALEQVCRAMSAAAYAAKQVSCSCLIDVFPQNFRRPCEIAAVLSR